MIDTKPDLDQDQTSNANQDPASGDNDSSSGAPLNGAHIDEDQSHSTQILDDDDKALAAAMAIMSGPAPIDDSDSDESDDDTDSSDDEGSDDPADKNATSSAHTKPKGDSRENKNSPSARIAHFSRLAKINADDADGARLETQRVQRQLSEALHKIDMLSNQLLEMRKLEMQLKELYGAAGLEAPQVSHQTPPAATYPETQPAAQAPNYAPTDKNRPMTVQDYEMAKSADQYRAQIETAIRNSSNPAVARTAIYKAIHDASELTKNGRPDLGLTLKSLIKMEHGMDILVALQNSRDDYRTLDHTELTSKVAKFYSKRVQNKTQDTKSRSIEQPRGAGAPKEQKQVNFEDPDEADAYLERLRAKRAGRKV